MTFTYIVVAVFIAYALWWWFVARNVPRYPPLVIDDDDPRMLAAIEKARGTLDKFRELLADNPDDAQVKIPFETNGGEIEHLWAEVLELKESEISVRYLTPPVSHAGKIKRLHEHPTTDIEDWAVFLDSGEIHGGYTQRVMFDIAREEYGELPKELEEQKNRYVD